MFGAKFVQLIAPPDPSAQKLHAGQVIQSQHVTVEINTVFQQLVDGAGQDRPGEAQRDPRRDRDGVQRARREVRPDAASTSTRCWPRSSRACRTCSHDIEARVAGVQRLRRRGTRSRLDDRRTRPRISNSIVDEQQNLDEFLVSAIGLADIGNEVVGANRQALTDVPHLLVPTTGLLSRVPRRRSGAASAASCRSRNRRRSTTRHPVSAGLTLGVERYRYPEDLPKVAATSGGASYCEALGLPDLPPNFVPPFVVADVGANPAQYGNQGILLNSDALKQLVVRPARRAAAQHRADRTCRDDAHRRGTLIKFAVFAAGDGRADRVPVPHLRPVREPVRRTATPRSSTTRRG